MSLSQPFSPVAAAQMQPLTIYKLMDVAVFHKVCFQKQSMYLIWSMDYSCIQGYNWGIFLNTHIHTQICTILNDFSLTIEFWVYFHLSLCLKNFPLLESIHSAKMSQVNVEPMDILLQVFFCYLGLDEIDKCRILEGNTLNLRIGRQCPLYNLLMTEITPANPGGSSDHSGMSSKSLWGRKNWHVKVMRLSTRHWVSQKEINHKEERKEISYKEGNKL